MSEPELPKELSTLADSLRSLQPRCDLPSRDRLMYEAGRRAARSNRVWPATSGLLAAALLVSIWTRPVAEPITIAHNGIPRDLGGPNYFHMRNAVLRDGLDALPAAVPSAAPNGNITTPLNSRFREEA